MCFHAQINRKVSEIEEYYNVSRTDKGRELDRELSYEHANGYDHGDFWVIPQESTGHLTPMMWGLLPYNKPGAGYKAYYNKAVPWGAGLNAQSEKLFSFWQYKDSSLTRRCIIPVTGFYEPHTCEKPKNYKVPFYFCPKEGPFINLAGIYSITPDKYVSFAILTKIPKEGSMYATIHNKRNRDGQHRQVVALDRSQMDIWLSQEEDERVIKDLLAHEYSESFIGAHSISKNLFSTKVNSNYKGIDAHEEHPQLQIPSVWS